MRMRGVPSRAVPGDFVDACAAPFERRFRPTAKARVANSRTLAACAGGQNVVVTLIAVGHVGQGGHVFRGIAEVAARIEISEHDFLLEARA